MPGPGPAEPAALHTARILLVDDLVPLLEAHRSYLKRTTCRILTARTGAEALAICRRERPDLIFLDASLPGMDGIEACRGIKTDAALASIPVILLAPGEREAECRNAGCEEVLDKPVSQQAFLRAVRRFVTLMERQERRIPASLRVTFTARAVTYTAYTKDLSPRGLFLKSGRPFVPGTVLALEIPLPGGTLVRATGEVRRNVERKGNSHLLPGIGVLFTVIDPASARAIEEFITARIEGAG
ncbi:MAG: response regulator [Candidatus Polarisedimenticolia bacterium]